MSEEKIDWYRTPIDRETMQQLIQRSDLRGFCQVIPQLLLTATTGIWAFYAFNHLPWYVTVAVFFLHGTVCGFLGAGGPVHELCHRTVFKTRFWNELALQIYSFLSWSHYAHFRASHAKHHVVTVYKEFDGEVVLPQKVTGKHFLMAFTCNPTAPFNQIRNTWRLACGKFHGDWELKILPESDSETRRAVINWARFMLVGHFILAALFIWSGHWILILIVNFSAAYGGWLTMLCGFPQHAGMQPNVPDFRLSCRTVLINPFARFLYWNMNYHVEHHMYAAVPFYNLPKLHALIKHDLPPANPSLYSAWKEIFAIQKRQESEPDYCFVPQLPEPR